MIVQRGVTGHGYVYYRTRSNGDDFTVYEHQLMALLENDPADVFDPEVEVHHLAPARDLNVPWLLDLVDSDEHRSRPRDRTQIRKSDALSNGDDVFFVTVEPDDSGVVESMASG